MKQISWRTLDIPGGRAPVAFTYQGARHPLVCLRSLLHALRLSWPRWYVLCLHVGDVNGCGLLPGQDAQGRPTYLLSTRHVPRFLAALAPPVARVYPAGSSRLAATAAQLSVRFLESGGKGAIPTPVKGLSMSAKASPSPALKKPTITREIEAQVFALAAQAISGAEIGRRLNIGATSVSLLLNGKYHFTAEQAARGRLADAVPMRHTHSGRPAKITSDTGRRVLALYAQGYAQAEVARRLGVGKSTVNMLVHGRYKFAKDTHA